MNFELNEEQKAFRDAAREFSEKHFKPHAAEWDEQCVFPVEKLKLAAEMGFMSLYTSAEAGGLGLSRLDASIVFEELSRGCTSTTAYITIHNMVNRMIDQFGDSELRDRYCPDLSSAEKLSSYCLTEPDSGSDAASLKTKAVKSGGHYLLTGRKAFISGGGQTQVLLVMARTGDDTPKGISAFVVDADSPGIVYGKKEVKMGWNSQPTSTITFEDCKVPVENLLGKEGEGFKIAMTGLDGGRINIGTCSVGTAKEAVEITKAYMQTRKQFNKKLSEFQALQFKLADMATETTAARQMVRHAASMLDNRHPKASVYCAMAKKFATDAGFRVCNEALQLHGGYGYIREYPLERFVRDLRVHQILEGTNEIMRLIVSKGLLQDDAGLILN